MTAPNPQIASIPESRTVVSPKEEEIRTWLLAHLAETLQVEPSSIDMDAPFDRYGLDSYAAVKLVGELEDWLKCELSPTSPYDHPTVARLARYLAEGPAQERL